MDLASEVVDNRGRSCPTADAGIPLIATNCIKPDHLYPVFENIRFVDDKTYESWFRGHPEPGDILFVCKGSPGRVALVPDPVPFCIAQDMVSIRANDELVYPRYLYYVLKNPKTLRAIENMHVGTMIPHFKKGDFKNLHLDIHSSLGRQRGIAEVLGALDGKIAANRKLAATADALARTNFRDATFRLLDDAGLDSTYDDVAVIGGGGTPKTGVPDYWDGEIPWATPTDITALDIPSIASTSRTITEDGLANSSARLYPTGSILMTSRATIGAFAIARNPVAVNQGFIVVNAKNPENQWWLFHDMRARVEEFIANANGATFLELPRGRFKSLPVAIPDHKVVAEFSAKAAGLHHVAVSASAESRTLGLIRDTLLPRMMSGELRVRDAEKVVENVL